MAEQIGEILGIWEIDPAEVKASVDKAIERIERHRAEEAARRADPKFKGNPWSGMHAYYDDSVSEQREHYTKVQIVKFAGQGRKPYRLCYAGDYTEGTGGFSTIQKAAQWFINGGR